MAAAKTTGWTYDSIMRDVVQKQFKPVYLLVGEESYYIDRIVEAIENAALSEDEKAFNLYKYYGMDANLGTVINSAKSYPMGAQYNVVELREAQQMKSLDDLSAYMQNPQPTTILIITYKNEKIDKRKKFVSAIASMGVLYETPKVRDNQLPGMVMRYVNEHGYSIDNRSASIISESIGADLSRLYGELDKLFFAMPEGERAITPEFVELHIGISKDFNYFELQDALITKNVFKANQIINYFDKNEKANPIQMILPSLFRFFSNLMVAHYTADKSSGGLALTLGMSDWQVRNNILPALKNYNARKVLQILEEIRAADEKSKGMNGSKVPSGDLLKSLMYVILH